MLIKALATPAVAGYSTVPELDQALPVFARLNVMPLAELSRTSTPFLVLNARRLAVAITEQPESQPIALKRFLISVVDSFSHVLEGTSIPIGLAGLVVFPVLGIGVGCEGEVVTALRVVSRNKIEVETSQRTIEFDPLCAPPELQLDNSLISTEPKVAVIADGLTHLFEDEYLSEIDVTMKTRRDMAELVKQALTLMLEASPASYQAVRAILRWVVPIRFYRVDVHRSFTSPRLSGVVFASLNADVLGMSEALVHETAHSELNMLLEIEELLPEHPEAVYYSPWRSDPRPISGLFHALYVFGKVLSFLQDIQTTARPLATEAEKHGFLIAHRIIIGHRQLRGNLSNPRAREIVDEALEVAEYYLTRIRTADIPQCILDHQNEWRCQHPELECMVA